MGVLGTGRIHNAIKVVYVFGVCGIAVYALADYGIAPSMQVTFDLAGTALPADQLAR